jgi:hypothetical protein
MASLQKNGTEMAEDEGKTKRLESVARSGMARTRKDSERINVRETVLEE